MAAFFLLTFFMESYLLRFKRQRPSWLKSTPSVRTRVLFPVLTRS